MNEINSAPAVLTERAYAKLNLSLDVTSARPDGYHDMVMVMQTISLCDELEISIDSSGIIRAETNFKFIPSDEQNLAVKAAKLYLNEINETCGMRIKIKKRIPVGAGMAGGSANAAAVLRALNRYYNERLSREQLLELSGKVGSDVAFCLVGGTKLAEGRGEMLTELNPLPQCWIAICKPSFSISTPELFRKLDKVKLRCHPDTAGMLTAIKEANLLQICRRLYNVFEDAGDRRLQVVSVIKNVLLDNGAHGAIMTGTGSAVFGIFTDKAKAETAAEQLKAEYGYAYVAEPVGTLL